MRKVLLWRLYVKIFCDVERAVWFWVIIEPPSHLAVVRIKCDAKALNLTWWADYLITHPAAPDPLWGNGRRWLEWTILYLPSSFQSSNHKLISAGLRPKSQIWELQSAWRRAQNPRRVHRNSKVVPWLGGTLDAGLERWPTGVGVPLFWSGLHREMSQAGWAHNYTPGAGPIRSHPS